MNNSYPYTVEFIGLSRNFGEHHPVLAGLKHAVGKYCVIMDDHLQNPHSEIQKLLRKRLLALKWCIPSTSSASTHSAKELAAPSTIGR